jgi:hypothetical protein
VIVFVDVLIVTSAPGVVAASELPLRSSVGSVMSDIASPFVYCKMNQLFMG